MALAYPCDVTYNVDVIDLEIDDEEEGDAWRARLHELDALERANREDDLGQIYAGDPAALRVVLHQGAAAGPSILSAVPVHIRPQPKKTFSTMFEQLTNQVRSASPHLFCFASLFCVAVDLAIIYFVHYLFCVGVYSYLAILRRVVAQSNRPTAHVRG
jgi:hypothetical protein